MLKEFNIKQYKISHYYFNGISILCASLVPLLVFGPFFPDLIVSLLSIWFLYYSFKNKIYSIYQNVYFYIFIAFWLTCILSSLLSENIIVSLKSSLFYIRIGIFALMISYLINHNKKILDYFYYAFLITFFALIIDGYIQNFTNYNIFGYKIDNSLRVSSFFGDELILGSYLTRLLPLCFALFFARTSRTILENYFFFIFLLMTGILVFMAGERASLYLFIISTLFLFFFLANYKKEKFFYFIIFLTLSLLLINTDTKFYNRYVVDVKEKLFKEKEIYNIYEAVNKNKIFFFSPSHDSLIRTAWNMFLDKPILGHGPKSYRLKCHNPKYAVGISPCHPHPHNFYVQLLAETGIVGFFFLSGLFFYLIYFMIRHILVFVRYKRLIFNNYQICLIAGLLITIWPITTNGNIFNNNLMLIYSLQMGFFRKI